MTSFNKRGLMALTLAGSLSVGSGLLRAAQFSTPHFTPAITTLPPNPGKFPKQAGTLPTPKDPDRAALFLLSRSTLPTNSVPTLPSTGGIASIDTGPATTGGDVDERIEMIRIKDLMRNAEDLVKDNRENDAVELYENNLATLVNDSAKVVVFNEISILLYKLNRYAEAAQYMQQALAIDGNNVQIASNLSAIYLYQGEINKALEVLGSIPVKIINDRQVLFTTHFNFACAYSMNQQEEEALTHLQVAAKIDPWQTFTSMGDVQLDNLRQNTTYQKLRSTLDNLLKQPSS